MLTDTIAAIATAQGEGSIAIVRVSGNQAINACARIFACKTPLTEAATHTIHYGHIIHPDSGKRVEEVLVSVMRAPRSFTTEDVVEINCHGGSVAANRVLSLLLKDTVRLSEPGEFSKRAFLNGRIDLTQAEAVIDLIRAKSDRAFQLAMKQIDGQLSLKINTVRQQLLQVIAHLEVNIDYPEHDTPELTASYISEQCNIALGEVQLLLRHAQRGKILRDGIITTITGRPNVGKSSLLNALLKENRAIVTDIPGTTRDVIEEYIVLNGIPLRLLDTAGIRQTSDLVEQIGVEKSRQAVQDAQLVLLVLNHNEPLHQEDVQLIEFIGNKPLIVLINKIDLPSQLELESVSRRLGKRQKIVLLSVRNHEGFHELESAVSDLFFDGQIESDDLTYVSNVRHVDLLEKTSQSLFDAIEATQAGMPIDIIQLDIRAAWEQLGAVIGDSVQDSLLDQIFSQFCLGK